MKHLFWNQKGALSSLSHYASLISGIPAPEISFTICDLVYENGSYVWKKIFRDKSW